MDSLQKFHKGAFTIITITGFAVIGFFLWLQYTGRTDTALNNWVTILSGSIFLIAAIISFIYYKKIGDRGGISGAILATGIANLLYAIGSAFWGYYNFVAGIELPYPSLADIFFVGMIIVYAFAVGSLFQIYRSSAKTSSIVVAVTVFALLVGVMFMYLGRPEISSELSFWTNFFNFSYALGDSIYVGSGVALLIIAGGKIYKGIFAWVVGMLLMTIADMVFTYRDAMGLLWNGDISDQIYTLSAIVFTYAVILLSKMPEQNKIKI